MREKILKFTDKSEEFLDELEMLLVTAEMSGFEVVTYETDSTIDGNLSRILYINLVKDEVDHMLLSVARETGLRFYDYHYDVETRIGIYDEEDVILGMLKETILNN